MKNKRYIVGFIISVVVLGYVFLKLDWQLALNTFSHLNWLWLLVAFSIYLANYSLRTYRFQILLGLEKTPFRRLFPVTNLYGMYLYLMPAKFGELSYPILLKNNLNVTITSSTATLIAARFFDFITIALFLPVALVMFWSRIPAWIRVSALAFCVLVSVLGGVFIWVLRKPDIFSFPKMKLSSLTFFKRVLENLYKVYKGLQLIDQQCSYWRLWLITIGIWVCVQANFYFIVHSLGYQFSFFQVIVASLIMVPMTLMPLQGFGNLGTHEIGWVAAFSLFGQSQASSLNIAVSSHIILLFFVLALGLMGYLLLLKQNNMCKTNTTSPVIICAANFILDRILRPVRFLLLPFRLCTQLRRYINQAIWLLSNEYAKYTLGSCGQGVRIHGRFRVTSPHKVHIEDNVHINDNAFIRAEGGLSIGENTHISRNLIVYTMNHQYEGKYLPYDEQRVVNPVQIERNVWIGMNVMILPGVSIGEGAIVGMGTLVSKDIPKLAIVGAAPQRILKMRDKEHYQKLDTAKKYSGMSGFQWGNSK